MAVQPEHDVICPLVVQLPQSPVGLTLYSAPPTTPPGGGLHETVNVCPGAVKLHVEFTGHGGPGTTR